MEFELLLSLILLSLSAVFSLYRQFQMLQQNSYFAARYFKWVKGSFAVRTVVLAILFFAACFLLAAKIHIPLLILSALLFVTRIIICITVAKKSIKPLKFTGRIKRLFAASVLTLCLLAVLFGVFERSLAGEICYTLLLMFAILTPLLALFSKLICSPIEKAFNLYYINDAKKILRGMKDLTVVGVTGSYGKTTTKFILNRILSEKYNTVCTPGSFNTTLGVVRTVREMLKPQTQIFVCEMGAKQKGDIKEICDIVKPKCGIITSVGEQHLETFKSVDNVFNTKFELCDSIEKNGGVCFVNLDSPGIAERIGKKPFATPIGENTDYFVSDIKSGPLGSSFILHIKDTEIALKTKLLGRHSIADICAAAVCAFYLGVDEIDIKSAVAALTPTEHRLELKPYYNGSTLLDDAYNSNPEGCIEALRVLGSFEGMNKTVITPGLIELGKKEYEANYNLGLACAEHADTIILVGKKYSAPIKEAVEKSDFDKSRLIEADSFKEALGVFLKYADKSSVLLIENDLPDNYLK